MRTLATLLLAVLAPTAAFAAGLDLPLDQSAIVTLRAPAHDVIVGNPAIADVSVSDRRHLIVTAKGAGVTNLMVTDASGRTILDEQVVVGAGGGNRVTMISGSAVQSYACAPRCEEVSGQPKVPEGGLFGQLFGSAAGAGASGAGSVGRLMPKSPSP